MNNLCYCNEKVEQITLYKTIKKDENYIFGNKILIKKCARPLPGSIFNNVKKKNCNYYNEEIINNFKNLRLKKSINKTKTKKNIKIYKNELLNLIKNYKLYSKINFAFFTKLNYYLYLFNYEHHAPYKETIEQLKYRVLNNINKKTIIYINKDIYNPELHLNQDECENCIKILNKEPVESIFNFKNHPIIIDILKNKLKINKKINEDKVDIEYYSDDEEEDKEEDKEDTDIIKDENDSDDESNKSDNLNKTENEFDMEIDEDDEIDDDVDDDYDDFSD